MDIETIVLGRVETNCYLLKTENTAVLIDTSEDGKKVADAVLASLGERKLDAIIFTHGHWDHVGGSPLLIDNTNATLYAYEDELEQISWGLDRVPRSKKLFHGVDVLLHDQDIVEIGDIRLKVLFTPGHTSGSICLYDEERGLLFAGDTLFNHSHGRTDFPTGSSEQMRKTLEFLATLPDKTKVFPGHRGPTTIAEERANGLIMYDYM